MSVTAADPDTPPPIEHDGPLPPPTTLLGKLRRLGPGMILAGAIVGSGELIATPKVGAEAGFVLLWLIILGCTLKVFTQIELGRHTITWGQTSLEAINALPGPRLRVHWVVWYWFAVLLLIVSQNGGIVGGVGQAMAMWKPLTEEGRQYNHAHDDLVLARVELARARHDGAPADKIASLEQRITLLAAQATAMREPHDVVLWAAIVAVLTSVVMYFGKYKFIEVASTVMVGSFTAVTLIAVFMLQSTQWAVHGRDLAQGLRFQLPPSDGGAGGSGKALATALACFGMIGLSAGELVMYPYWCLEKGYAHHAGPRDATPQWAGRAKGWMSVMHLDVWLSMLVYTFATVAFYLLGAGVLWRSGLNPEGQGMIRTLAQMYVPVFGSWAHAIFLFGAFNVLYSTYFVFAAGFGRIVADCMRLLGLIDGSEETGRRWVRIISVSLPLVALVLYLFVRSPVAMVLAAGLGQATMMPILGGVALYLRYRRIDPRLRPGLVHDVLLWVCFIGLLVIGSWSVYGNLIEPWLKHARERGNA